MLLKARVLLLSLTSLLLLGSVAVGTASAAAGPFFYGREAGGKGTGEGLGENGQLQVKGTGGEQILKGTVGTTPVLLKSPGVKITGSLWNNSLQGQVKLELTYSPITISEPKLANCQAEVFTQPGGHNLVFAEGHLGWTWNGTKEQLEEKPPKNQKPDIIFTPPGTRIQEGATELPKGSFAEIKFVGSGCGVLAGTFKISGSTVGSLKPENLEEWSTTPTVNTPEGKAKQHFWNGKEMIGVETGLVFAGNPASLIGETKTTAEGNQEIATREAVPPSIVVLVASSVNFGLININEEKEHTFTYKNNTVEFTWTPKVVFNRITEENGGGWASTVVDGCRNMMILAGGTCTVTLKTKTAVAGGTFKQKYRTGLAAPWLTIEART